MNNDFPPAITTEAVVTSKGTDIQTTYTFYLLNQVNNTIQGMVSEEGFKHEQNSK